jgi:Zn-dependent peptidase ImmA (M78 family)
MAVIKKKIEPTDVLPKTVVSPQQLRIAAAQRGIETSPLDVRAVIEKLFSIRVCMEQMDREVSGYLERRGSTWVIGINIFHSPRRQRFTMAHELGHYLLHRDSLDGEKKIELMLLRSDASNSTQEKQANEFASELLIPSKELEKNIKDGIDSIDMLSEVFEVSIAAIRYKAYKLGYLGRY